MGNESKTRARFSAFQWGMLTVAVLLLARGVWGVALGVKRPVLQEVVLVAGSILLGFLYLLLLDYLLHHARLALLAMVALGGYFLWGSPEFATGTSVALAYLMYESV